MLVFDSLYPFKNTTLCGPNQTEPGVLEVDV